MNLPNDTGREVYRQFITWGFTEQAAQYITAQMAHESANFTSPLFQQNNNCTGMKYVGQAAAIGEKNGHAEYKTLFDCLNDYRRYFIFNKYPKVFDSIGDFVALLKRKRYFEASEAEYKNGVTWFYNIYFGG